MVAPSTRSRDAEARAMYKVASMLADKGLEVNTLGCWFEGKEQVERQEGSSREPEPSKTTPLGSWSADGWSPLLGVSAK